MRSPVVGTRRLLRVQEIMTHNPFRSGLLQAEP